MIRSYRREWLTASLSIVLFAFFTASCSGLAGEPRIVATFAPTPAPARPVDVGFPQTRPNLERGAQIFADNCTRCHGETGRGDGPLIGPGDNQINEPPPDFTNADARTGETPASYFEVITNGRLDRLMPPWDEALNETERWAVASYVYSLHYTPDMIDAGRATWAEADGSTEALPSLELMVGLTDEALVEASLPENEDVSAEQQQSLAAYLRTQYFLNVDILNPQQVAQEPTAAANTATEDASSTVPESPIQTEEAVSEAPLSAEGQVTGMVTHGTGDPLPDGLVATLHVFDPDMKEETFEAPVGPDGSYRFEYVPISAERGYVVTVDYTDRIFGSDFAQGDPMVPDLDLPVMLYEVTGDELVIQIRSMVTQMTANENALQVAEVVSYTNTSDQLFSTDESFGPDQFASVRLPLPPGAEIVGFAEDERRYVLADDGSAILDTVPVLPGENHIMHVIYNLPYDGSTSVALPLHYALAGQSQVLLSPETVTLSGERFELTGPQVLRNIVYNTYTVFGPVPAGTTLEFQISGSQAGSTGASAIPADMLLPAGLVILGLVIVGVGGLLYMRDHRKPAAKPASNDTLMDGLIRQIAELDEQRADGQIDDATYQKRRTRLKERLAEIMDQE